MARLSDPVTILKGVGPARAKQLANLNIVTLGDLICHFPRGYEDRTQLVPIARLEIDVPACFRGMVMNTPRTTHIRKGLDITLDEKPQTQQATAPTEDTENMPNEGDPNEWFEYYRRYFGK